MLISRLQAYGLKWKTWCNKNRWTGNNWNIPSRHQHKVLLDSDPEGNYTICQKVLDFHKARYEALANERDNNAPPGQ